MRRTGRRRMMKAGAADDESREFRAFAPPLLLGVFLDELFENILAHKRQCLFFEVGRLPAVQCCHSVSFLFLNLCRGFCWCFDSPQLVEGVHVEGEVVELAFIVGYGGVGVAVELNDRVHEVPNLLVGSVENMCAVFMDVNTLDLFTINVASQMGAFVNHKAGLACLTCLVGEGGTEEAGTNDEIVVFHFSKRPTPTLPV